nr:hypothetical protein [Tanacetum cinerariifolium]
MVLFAPLKNLMCVHGYMHITTSVLATATIDCIDNHGFSTLQLLITPKMSKPIPQAIETGKMTLFQPDIVSLQDIRATHTRKRIEVRVTGNGLLRM